MKNFSLDSSAIFSVLIGLFSFAGSIPVGLPVIGLALGINAILKERKLPKRKPSQLYLGIVGCVLCGLATLIILFIRTSLPR